MKLLDLKSLILHLFEIHLDSCLVININDLYRYIESCGCFGNKTKSEIRETIIELHDSNLIKVVLVNNHKFIVYK